MSLLNYQVFMEVYSNQSFARAAENLHMSPSAVSHAVAKLEDEVGFPLLIRNRGELELTDGGEELIPVIRNIVSSQNLLDEKIDYIQGLSSGKVRIGAMGSIFMSWLPDIIGSYKERYPDVCISATQGGYNKLREYVMDGMLDIAFIARSAADDLDSAFEFTPLYEDPLILVAPKDMRVTKNKYVTQKDLKKLNIIEYETGEDSDIYPLIANAMPEDDRYEDGKYRFSATDDSALLNMVRHGLGCAIMPELCTRGHVLDNTKIYLLKEESYREIGILTRSKKQQSPATKTFVTSVKEYVKKQG